MSWVDTIVQDATQIGGLLTVSPLILGGSYAVAKATNTPTILTPGPTSPGLVSSVSGSIGSSATGIAVLLIVIVIVILALLLIAGHAQTGKWKIYQFKALRKKMSEY